MAWDKTKPASGEKLRTSRPEIVENWDCLEDALAREHTFPGEKGSTAGKHVMMTLVDQAGDPATPPSGQVVQYSKAQLPFLKNASGAVVRLMLGEGGGATKCYFLQDTAPIGWTIETGCADALLAVKGGSNAYNVVGGTKLAGSWTPTPHHHDVTIGNHAHTTDSHSHSVNAHTHDVVIPIAGWPYSSGYHNIHGYLLVGNRGDLTDNDIMSSDRTLTSASGGGGSTGSGGGGSTSSAGGTTVTSANGAGPATDRPLANVGIIASLN